ncbi:MAG TPA: DUF4082 domain-containing protein [Rhizomicrobium sp.]|nr:DUF4082 domain-containing protein [Rhizomicrobium sp.]
MRLSFLKWPLGIFAALLFAGLCTESQSAPINPAVSFSSYPNDLTTGAWSLGFVFSPNDAITVTQLGIFDDGTNEGSVHAVGIFDALGNLLASTSITQGDGYSNFFDWASISPLSLNAGQQYRIAEETGTSNYAFAAFPFITVNPDIDFIGSAYVLSPTLVFPEHLDSLTWGYFGPNFSIGVPEPASLPMLVVGLIGGFYFWRKRPLVL